LGHLSTFTPDFCFEHGKLLDLKNTISRIQTKQLREHQQFSNLFLPYIIMQMKNIAIWLLPIFHSELFG